MKHSHPSTSVCCVCFAALFFLAAGSASAGILDLSAAPIETSGVHGPDNPTFVAENAFDANPGTRWAAIYAVPNQWVYVDLGADHVLNTVSVDWETANATSFNILTRTSAQVAAPDPADWTPVATVTGSTSAGGGGAMGGTVMGFDQVFDFNAGTVESGIGGTNTIDVPNPVGRYVMLNGFDYAGSCCNGASIWEIQIDADPGQLEDTDGDGMPDAWEEENGTNPAIDDAADDPDADSSPNIEEYNRATDPQEPDTDQDGYLDGVETKTGVWVSAEDTGTDPRNPDSDGDTLDDGLENPDEPFVNADQPGTDPNLVDTDGDTLSDSVELAGGSDPTDPASPGILDLSGATVVESSIHGGQPQFVGSNAFDGSVGTRWAAEFPNTSQWVYVDLGEDRSLTSVTIDWETANATNYTLRMWPDGTEPTDIPDEWTTVATITGTGGLPGGGAVGNDHLFNFNDGTLSDISGIGIGGEATDIEPNPVGRYLMIEASDYSTTCCGGPSIWEVRVIAGTASMPFSITDFDYVPGSGEATVTWNSRPGRTYAAFWSSDLVNWRELDDGILSEGETTSYTDTDVPLDAKRRYYRIEQL